MRDAFAVLFFVSAGMLLDPRHLLEAPGLVVATLGVILLGKPLAALGLVLLLGYPIKVALAVAVALAQIGEFSFILAALGKELGLLTDTATNTIVAAAIISLTLNPLLYGMVHAVEAWAARRWRWRSTRIHTPLAPAAASTPDSPFLMSPSHRAVVVGYGPVGQTVTRLLRDNGIEPTVIELNRDTVRRLREDRDNSSLWRCKPSRDVTERRGGQGRESYSQCRQHARKCRDHPFGTGTQSGYPDLGPYGLRARASCPASGRSRERVFR